ncbi:TIM barrel protein [Rhodobacteraceae bacterium 2CG4]|uniref:TIM barrel protein n=1 Tax=Halovulum marinum TaxID=2662447 RepID=A0A6L5Z2J0_9RHOB|nr:TIM barrel protein [Halovulum marinum]
MRLALCNEVLRAHPLPEQCRIARALGYDALEIAPFTLSDDPARLPRAARRDIRTTIEDAGLAVAGLHWLMTAPAGLSITDPVRADRAAAHMAAMAELCADLGGAILVHGSPEQRDLAHAPNPEIARETAARCFARAGAAAEAAGVTYCLEPLAPVLTGYLNTVAECAALLDQIASPGLSAMLDTSAAAGGETEPPDAVLARWLPTGRISHVHLNDPNRRAPGQGRMQFGPVMQRLLSGGYDGFVSVEPFVYQPSGEATAAVAAGYLRGILESIGDAQ